MFQYYTFIRKQKQRESQVVALLRPIAFPMCCKGMNEEYSFNMFIVRNWKNSKNTKLTL